MVWARIQDPINEKARPDLIVSLIRQLAEASMTLDISRCVSGRIARIIQSLEAIDTEDVVNIASTEDIRRELSDKVPALLARVADQDDTKYLKDFVDKELRKDYVLTDLLTETEYTKIVKDYLDAID
jgi:predicted transcriptional regulator